MLLEDKPNDRERDQRRLHHDRENTALELALLLVQFTIAWTMPHIGRDTKPETLINLHFSLGVVILLVVLIRLVWRVIHGDPPPMDGVAP